MKRVLAVFALVFLLGSDQGRGAASVPAGFTAVKGSGADAATGLPKQIVHEATGLRLVLVPAGEFLMGSPDDDPDRGKAERRHRRVIRKPFYLGATEVTAGQFRKFVEATGYRTDAERGSPDGGERARGAFAMREGVGDRKWSADASWHNPFPSLRGFTPRDDYPVVQVSWADAQAFCTHFGLRLPTEAEWEYACRAGSPARFPWGDDPAGGQGRCNVTDASTKKRFDNVNLLFPFDDGHAVVAPVGGYKPNAWGLHDMIGNVEEWCQDAYGKYPADGADESAALRAKDAAGVTRGGSFLGNVVTSRCASRTGFGSTGRRDFVGFRVAVSVR
jgi:formylglycine-generating enzyme required for sulfatase activity